MSSLDERQCPHPTCAVVIDWRTFACRRHWFSLPPTIRNPILSAWRGLNNGRAEAIEQLEAAQQAALDYWNMP